MQSDVRSMRTKVLSDCVEMILITRMNEELLNLSLSGSNVSKEMGI